ncbi:glycosyltransferase family 4 protein [Patescibacteria group bacterium]|nr:glycosyltransferase family 4 protein [Patescibacteria group bacterium]
MKIGIDARLYGTKHRGLGRYVQKLVDGVAKADDNNQYVVFLASENFDSFNSNNQRVKKVLLNVRWYSFKEQYLVPLVIKKEKVDLMHFPHFNVPLAYNRRFIVTIHDLIIKHFPNSRATNLPNWKYKLKLKGFDRVLNHAVQKSEKIIVPSNFVKGDIVSQFQISDSKIKIIYEGYFLETHKEAADISRFGICKPYLLYVGAAYPHKNLERLVRVFKKLNQNCEYQLIFVGDLDSFYQRIQKLAGDCPDIIFTGYVAESELAGLYQQSILYVFPSLYEGFGLPPIEAQAHQAPVVSSNRSSLPEVLKDSAVYFNPENEEEMLEKIKSVLTDENFRRQFINRGLENIKRFSWEKMASETINLYKISKNQN